MFLGSLLKVMKSSLVFLPASKTLTYNFNYGSMLGMVLILQMLTGFLLTFYYVPKEAFKSVSFIMRDVCEGWWYRTLHLNGANLLFVVLYAHFFKGLFYCSWRLKGPWLSGLTLLLLLMLESFLGYTLPYTQMSYWAAVVITSMLTVLPGGQMLVELIWCGPMVNYKTILFFAAVHYHLPWVMMIIVVLHVALLHDTGSTSDLYMHGDYDKITFFPYYWMKDAMNLLIWYLLSIYNCLLPWLLTHSLMFLEANPLYSPKHLTPEWYFLFGYAILRSIYHKTLGVVALLLSILLFYFFVFLDGYNSPLDVMIDWGVLLILFMLVGLSMIGTKPAEGVWVMLGFYYTVCYFFSVVFFWFCVYFSNKLFI